MLSRPAESATVQPSNRSCTSKRRVHKMAIDRRDADASGMVEPTGHLVHRVGLAPEVELGPQALSELLEHVAGPNAPTEGRAPLRKVGEQAERRQVALHRFLDARALDLDDNCFAGAQPRQVGLADRRRRERLPVELREQRLESRSELGLEHFGDPLARFGRYVLLETGELGADVAGQEVDASRGDLAELDVDAAGRLEHAPQPHRLGVDASARRAPSFDMSGPKPSRRGERGRARGSGAGRAMRLRTARRGRVATTRPARSPMASDPGRASRSNATAVAIVVGMPMARRCSIRPSAPQSQWLTPRATTIVTPQPDHAGEQRRHPAAADAEQAQGDDGDDDGGHGAADDAHGDAGQRRRDQLMAAQEGEPRRPSRCARARQRPRRTTTRSERRFTSRTRSARGWNAERRRRARRSPTHWCRRRTAKRYVTHPPSSHVHANCSQVRRELSRVARSGACPARRWAPPWRR